MNETLHIAPFSSFFPALKLEDIKNKIFYVKLLNI